MTDLFLTLLSDVTSDYANNETNQFKVKLSPSLYLPGSGWKVSIAYAMLPKISLFKVSIRCVEKRLFQSGGFTQVGESRDMSRWGGFFQFPQTLVNFQSDSQYVVMLHFREG